MNIAVGNKIVSSSPDFGLIPHTVYVVMCINPRGVDGKTVYTVRPFQNWLVGDTNHNDRCISDLCDVKVVY